MRYLVIVASLLAVGISGCREGVASTTPAKSAQTADQTAFKISPDLAGMKRERKKFGSLPDSVIISMPYIFRYRGNEKSAQVLLTNVTINVGGKFDSKLDGNLISIIDGLGHYDCSKYIGDFDSSKSDSDMPELTCSFEVLGALPLKAVTVDGAAKPTG